MTRSNVRARPTRLALLLPLLAAACGPADVEDVPRSTLIIGLDVSGSFRTHGRYEDAMPFAAHYIHARLNGLGGLEVPRVLFVGTIGGDAAGEPHSFRPIHDFEGKTPAEIEADLRRWFNPRNQYTDFNAFFERAATLVKRQNLVLTPVSIVILSDGEPDIGPLAYAGGDSLAAYRSIDMKPLDYLSRNVTVRLLYPDPTVAVWWEQHTQRTRVRLWTVDRMVMQGWRRQLRAEHDASEQDALWRWIQDNVDYRVRRSMI